MKNIMTKSFYPLLALFTFFFVTCKDTSDYKAIRKEVIDVHDEAMLKTSLIIQNKMTLDTLLSDLDSLKKNKPALDTMQMSSDIRKLITNLNMADEQMNEWMHEFDPDVSRKSNQEAIKYFKQQLIEIKHIDSLCRVEIDNFNSYLQKISSK